MTVHSLPDAASVPRRSLLQLWLVVLVCLAPVVASYMAFYVFEVRGSAYGTLIQPTREIPQQLPIHNGQGQALKPESLKGQWLLVVVSGGACPEQCERQLFMQRQLRDMLGKEREKLDKVWIVSDAVAIRPELTQALSQGLPPTVLRIPAEALQQWLAPDAGRALADHLYLVDPLGRWMWRAPVDADPMKIKKDLDRLIKANAGWDRPGR
ncbi:SCO family protein [Roseateles sp. BYS180W]|uniref:SCO family protein n=1 Tax=Roseateles rivi TaxID=3299028 RepID=A0ABW7FRI4_9BURK